MRGLKTVYDGKLILDVKKVGDLPEGAAAKYFPNSKHGLLAFDGNGEIVDSIEGHNFGKDEIVAVIKKML